jgi:hypothetical protein
MKGIIFNLLEEVVTQNFGEDAWDDVLDRVGLEGSYTSLGSYGDEQFVDLLGALPAMHGSSEAELVRWFGRSAIPLLADRYPMFFEAGSTRAFLLTLNNIIHPEVRKLYPGADVPVFEFDDTLEGLAEDQVVLGYRSPRQLCVLAEGFIEGAAFHFGERAHIEQPTCMIRGDERCAIVCSFEQLA